MAQTRVIDLEIGDGFKYNQTTLFVRAIDRNKCKVLATKHGVKLPNGCISIGFYSADHDDLMRRVETTCRIEEV